MREILFRGKRIDNGEWVEGCLTLLDKTVTFAEITYQHEWEEGKFYIVRAEVEPDTVGQYTGLTDTNGKMIFEGDIIKSWQGKILAVKFGQYHDDEEVIPGNGWYVSGEYGTLSFDERWGGHEIIGNIHDNPDFDLRGAGA